MKNIQEAITLAQQAFKDDCGEDATLEDGEEYCTVFNDGILIIGMENGEMNISFHIGKPFRVYFDLDLEEKEVDAG